MTGRAVFLDRDGVINRAIVREGRPYPPESVAELVIEEEVAPALDLLKEAEFLRVVVTNQPDVARGTQTREGVEAIHRILREQLPLDDICVCYHDDQDRCRCRKPLPGLLLDAARRWSVDLNTSYMIGDRWKDIEAGRRAGCATVLIDRGYQEVWSGGPPDVRVDSLSAAVRWILDRVEKEKK